MIRQAIPSDIAGMHRVRMAVRENRLESLVLTEACYLAEIELPGRGWVIETNGSVVAFGVGSSQTGNIWALFVDPAHEGCGYGRQLLGAMVDWHWSRGCERLWLTTAPGTRAERFYLKSGWQHAGTARNGEVIFELRRPAAYGLKPARPAEADGKGRTG